MRRLPEDDFPTKDASQDHTSWTSPTKRGVGSLDLADEDCQL